MLTARPAGQLAGVVIIGDGGERMRRCECVYLGVILVLFANVNTLTVPPRCQLTGVNI